jgi:hypothetical protein
MFFIIKTVNGQKYLYKLKSHREKGVPTHTQIYVGPLDLVQRAINKNNLGGNE